MRQVVTDSSNSSKNHDPDRILLPSHTGLAGQKMRSKPRHQLDGRVVFEDLHPEKRY
jgi:hypothetical protein